MITVGVTCEGYWSHKTELRESLIATWKKVTSDWEHLFWNQEIILILLKY